MMTNAASTSNPSFIVDVGKPYPYPSHFLAPNFVTMKLSGKDTYNMWETQILCLLKSHHMYGFIDGQFPRPAGTGKEKERDMEAWDASNSLVKCWILGTLCDEVAKKAVNRLRTKDKKTDFSAKDLWDELQRNYDPWVVAETKLTIRQAESVIEVSEDAKSKDEPTEEKTRKEEEKTRKENRNRWLYDLIIGGRTKFVILLLEELGLNPWDKLTNIGNTILHVAVASSTKNHFNCEFLKKLLEMTPKEKLLDLINSDGSTLLHVAAIGGNIEAVDILVEKNPELLLATDNAGHTPLTLSVSNMHSVISKRLFKNMKEKALFSHKSCEEFVVLAISCRDFNLAKEIISEYPDAIVDDSDAVLTALAQNFPREPNFWETKRGLWEEADRMAASYMPTFDRLCNYADSSLGRQPLKIFIYLFFILLAVFCVVRAMFYGFLKVLVRLFLVDTNQDHEDATNLLYDVCKKILTKDNSGTYHQYYTPSIFEATRRNVSTFIRCIMMKFPDAIRSTNEDGHNFIQYSVIIRSEKIYNLLHEMIEHKNIYKTIKDPLGNSLLHLVARLGPPKKKLGRILGPALQIQRELQWFKEVEQFVCPVNRIQKNAYGETPEMVFLKEHKDLMIEGHEWIKKIAESYSITSTIIITIVFAAAITVPGGNNQESGIPIFTNNIAFTIFAISDAISLFTGVTSLLMFLSILAIHGAQDFLYNLPTKLIIGLTMVFLSTTAMIIAFGATLFLVFGQSNSSMLIPIGALTCLPITCFVTLQFPLTVDLISATYCGGFFVREEFEYFY